MDFSGDDIVKIIREAKKANVSSFVLGEEIKFNFGPEPVTYPKYPIIEPQPLSIEEIFEKQKMKEADEPELQIETMHLEDPVRYFEMHEQGFTTIGEQTPDEEEIV